MNTKVSFPDGTTSGEGRVVWSGLLPGHERAAVVTDQTPFHPVDHTWPDQPADRGTLAGIEVLDCVTGAQQAGADLLIGAGIPARRGDPHWEWLVVHVLPPDASLPEIGDPVELRVDQPYRRALSLGHTACHLAALALNFQTRDFWRKEPPRRDSLGSPDSDGIAIQRSVIAPGSARDEYKLGKSIRKKGLNVADLISELDEVQDQVNGRLAAWIKTDASVAISAPNADLTAMRRWSCALPEGVGEYPCGGTHIQQLSDLGRVEVRYVESEEGFVATTTAASEQ